MFKKIGLAIAVFALFFPLASLAQNTVVPDTNETIKARVLDVISQSEENIPDLAIKNTKQILLVAILPSQSNPAEKSVRVENDYVPLKKGDTVYIAHTTNALDGTNYYTVQDPDRMPVLYILIALFILLAIIFGGKQGVRGLAALIGSFVLIFFVLIPGIARGYSPVFMALGISSLIIIVGSYITHGFNRTTSAAVLGMIATVVVTGTLAVASVHAAKLTGFTSDEAINLNFNTGGTINFVSLLLGGIMIGLLGVLYDMAIGQAIAIEELRNIGPHVPRLAIFKRAIRIGREHIGALVNTLVIAYVGASLPLILFIYSGMATNPGSHEPTINQEIFATEIVRTLIGAIGIVIAMPITTFIASLMLVKKADTANTEKIAAERAAIEHFNHSH